MNKNDLIQELASRLSVPQKDCRQYLDTLLDIVSDDLSGGNNLILQGFGTFSHWEQTARIGRNPRTGTPCPILARRSVKFKPGKFLLEKMNERKA